MWSLLSRSDTQCCWKRSAEVNCISLWCPTSALRLLSNAIREERLCWCIHLQGWGTFFLPRTIRIFNAAYKIVNLKISLVKHLINSPKCLNRARPDDFGPSVGQMFPAPASKEEKTKITFLLWSSTSLQKGVETKVLYNPAQAKTYTIAKTSVGHCILLHQNHLPAPRVLHHLRQFLSYFSL